ncbi:hypothetical protein E4T56_gene9055 [Termitomyces sp. T112]|nr:hypothetical protein E4T56_gene9055 [Termitomyces sp. T112]
MPSILNLKFKGNKSFVAFSNLGDAESLTKTWKVCTKVASYLEQGSRLENLSWRLWHLQSLMVDSDNAKSKREFRKMSKSMGDKLDKEKGRSIEELAAPDYKANASGDLLRQRAEEKERNRAMPGTIKRMQFTFNLDNPSPAVSEPVTRPSLKPSAEFTRVHDDDNDNDNDNKDGRRALRFPSLFSSDFGPSALLDATPTVATSMSYGEGPTPTMDTFGISRPTIELPLDELLDGPESFDPWALAFPDADVVMQAAESDDESSPDSDDEDSEFDLRPPARAKTTRKRTQAAAAAARAATPTARPALTVRTSAVARSAGPGATSSVLRSTLANSGPGGQKAECSNCGATHTPLWRRGLNDELNCNACGLYCKLHKRPRPKSMRTSHGERAQAPPRHETVDVMAQCYNCHTTATPLWRKDDEGKTVCNACGLYYKLHGSARPISMKSDVIRKRSRHDARRGPHSAADTPSASPGVSRRASPARDASPTLAPDSTTQITYDYADEIDYRSSHSELLGALGPHVFQYNMYPGPYHPDYLSQAYTAPNDPLPFAPTDPDLAPARDDPAMSPRTSKRRRMSTDSASEPPSSASYSSYTDGYTTSSSATSHSLDFPFSPSAPPASSAYFSNGPALRGSGNTFWHPPMMPQAESDAPTGEHSPHIIHPPMLPPPESPMDYLQQPAGLQPDEELFSSFLHPPMVISDDFAQALSNVHPPMLMDYHVDVYDSLRVY